MGFSDVPIVKLWELFGKTNLEAAGWSIGFTLQKFSHYVWNSFVTENITFGISRKPAFSQMTQEINCFPKPEGTTTISFWALLHSMKQWHFPRKFWNFFPMSFISAQKLTSLCSYWKSAAVNTGTKFDVSVRDVGLWFSLWPFIQVHGNRSDLPSADGSYNLYSPHLGLHVPLKNKVYKSWHSWQLSVSRNVAKMLASSLRPPEKIPEVDEEHRLREF